MPRTSRTIWNRLAAALLVTVAVTVAPLARAQHAAPDIVGFVVHRGADTATVERARRSGDSLVVDMISLQEGGARVALAATVTPQQLVSRMEIRAWVAGSPAGAPPRQRAAATFRGDTILLQDASSGGSWATAPVSRVATTVGAMPYYNVVVALLEQIVRRARVIAAGRAAGARNVAVAVPVFVIASGGQTAPAIVAFAGGDSVVLSLGGTELHLAVDRAGRVLGGAIPARGVVIERVSARVIAPLVNPAARGRSGARPHGTSYAATGETAGFAARRARPSVDDSPL